MNHANTNAKRRAEQPAAAPPDKRYRNAAIPTVVSPPPKMSPEATARIHGLTEGFHAMEKERDEARANANKARDRMKEMGREMSHTQKLLNKERFELQMLHNKNANQDLVHTDQVKWLTAEVVRLKHLLSQKADAEDPPCGCSCHCPKPCMLCLVTCQAEDERNSDHEDFDGFDDVWDDVRSAA